jgi:hypothetical protein
MGKVKTTRQEAETRLASCEARGKLLDTTIRALLSEQKAIEGAIAADTARLAEVLALAELGEVDASVVEAVRAELRAKKVRRSEISLAKQGLQAMEKENYKARTLAQNRLFKFQAEEDYTEAVVALQAKAESGMWDRNLESNVVRAAADVGKSRKEVEAAVRELKTTYEQLALAGRRQ